MREPRFKRGSKWASLDSGAHRPFLVAVLQYLAEGVRRVKGVCYRDVGVGVREYRLPLDRDQAATRSTVTVGTGGTAEQGSIASVARRAPGSNRDESTFSSGFVTVEYGRKGAEKTAKTAG